MVLLERAERAETAPNDRRLPPPPAASPDGSGPSAIWRKLCLIRIESPSFKIEGIAQNGGQKRSAPFPFAFHHPHHPHPVRRTSNRHCPTVRVGIATGGDPGIAIASLFMMPASLVPVAACGLPLALGCRRLQRLGYRRGAWVAGVVLGALTTAASVLAGLLGPIAIALFAVVLSGPVWAAWFWLRRRR